MKIIELINFLGLWTHGDFYLQAVVMIQVRPIEIE